LKKTKWIPIFEDKSTTDDIFESNMLGKYIKSCPHKFSFIKDVDYLCYFDTKVEKISEAFVEEYVEKYFVQANYAILLRAHPYLGTNVWDEVKESLRFMRYKLQEDKIKKYIKKQVDSGLKEQTERHACTGFIIRNMKHSKINDLNEFWYKHIEECGIQCQISFFFVKQLFPNVIHIFSALPFERCNFTRKIHLICKNKEMLENEIYQKTLSAYKKIYLDYEIKIYHDEDIYRLIKTHFPDDYESMKEINGEMLYDAFCYLILYLEGGIYSDFYCQPIKKIEEFYTITHWHGWPARSNNFFIYPKNEPLPSTIWDFYENPCNNSCFINREKIDTYECRGHKYVEPETNIIICKDNMTCPVELQTVYNDSTIFTNFIISKPNTDIFLKCYKKIVEIQKQADGYSGSTILTKIVNESLPDKRICILPSDFFCAGSNSVQQTRNSYVLNVTSSA